MRKQRDQVSADYNHTEELIGLKFSNIQNISFEPLY